MPEVIGDAGILIDPKNAFKLANALIDLIENDQVRNMFIERGRERIKNSTGKSPLTRFSKLLKLYANPMTLIVPFKQKTNYSRHYYPNVITSSISTSMSRDIVRILKKHQKNSL